MQLTINRGPWAAQIRLALLLVIICLIGVPNLRAQYAADIYPSTQSGNIILAAGTAASPIQDVYGMVATFSGDFSGLDENSIGVDWTGSWLMVDGGIGAHQWVIDNDEGGATLTVWRTDEENVSGYGKVLEMEGATIVGELVLDDLARQTLPFSVTSIQILRRPNMDFYPLPGNQILYTSGVGMEDAGRLEVYSMDGVQVYDGQVGDAINVQNWQSGVYVAVGKLGGDPQRKLIMIAH